MNKIKMYIVARIPYTGEYDIKSIAPCIETIEFRFGHKIIPFGFDDWECEIDKDLNSVIIGWQSGKSFLKSDGISEVYRDDILDVGIDPDKITADFLSKPDAIVSIYTDITIKNYNGDFINIDHKVSIEAIVFVDENHTAYSVAFDKISQFNRKDNIKPVEIVYKYIPYRDVTRIIGYSNTNDTGITTSRYGGNFTIEEGTYYSSVKQLVVSSAETLEFGGNNIKYFLIRNNGKIDYRTVSRILVFIENLSTINDVDESKIITKIIEYFPDGVRVEMSFGTHNDHTLATLIFPSDYIYVVGVDHKSIKLVNLLLEENK